MHDSVHSKQYRECDESNIDDENNNILNPYQCPVFDLERNIEFSGYWQTVSRQGGITIPVSDKDFYNLPTTH